MTATPDAPPLVIAGREITLPVEVRVASMVAAQFVVDAGAAQRVIDHTGLRVARLPGGRALVALSAVNYADSDLDAYHEFAVAVVVEPHDAPPGAKPSFKQPSTLIHRLPVDQSFTCEVGRELWGFPKWVCDIDHVAREKRTDCVVSDGGELVVGLEVRRGIIPLPEADTEMRAYSWRDGVLRCTPWTTRNHGARARLGGATVSVGTGHPMADELRALGLPKRAVMCTSVGLMTARFGAPEVIEL